MSVLRYAIVTPTYEQSSSTDVLSFTSTVAKTLSTRATVEILTTRSSTVSWPKNEFEEGHELINGMHVRRFSCARSTETIVTYLENFEKRYDCFLFIGQLDRIAPLGLDRVFDRAVVVPFEVPPVAQIAENVRLLLRGVTAFVFPSARDRARVQSIDGTSDGPVASSRVMPPSSLNPKRFRTKNAIFESFFVVPNTSIFSESQHRLLQNFAHYREETGSRRKLVFVGMPPPAEFAIPRNVQFVISKSSDEAWDAIAAAEATCIIDDFTGLENCWRSWSVRKPIVAHVSAGRVVDECRHASGGLWYEGPEEFAAILELTDERQLVILGSQGKQYLSQYESDAAIVSVLRQFFDNG